MKGFIRTCAAVWMLCAITGHSLQAQEAFSSISVGAMAAQEIAQGRFDELWDTSPSGGLVIRIPFHVGEMEAGFSVARNTAQRAQMPHFTSSLIHAGWGPALDISSQLRARMLLLAGDFFMVFDEGAQGYSRRENELLLGAAGGFSYLVGPQLAFFARATFFRVYTSTPIEFIQVGGGLELRLPTSERIRSLLR